MTDNMYVFICPEDYGTTIPPRLLKLIPLMHTYRALKRLDLG